jgi:hypothetical protein
MSDEEITLEEAQAASRHAEAEFRLWSDAVRAANDRGEAPDTRGGNERIATLTGALTQRAEATAAASKAIMAQCKKDVW